MSFFENGVKFNWSQLFGMKRRGEIEIGQCLEQ